MHPDGFIDLVRESAYPDDRPGDPEHERAVCRAFLEALDRIRRGKGGHGLALRMAGDEARRVFDACLAAAGL